MSRTSGQLDWWRAWIYLALYAGGIAATTALARGKNPGGIGARAEMQSEAKGFAKLIVTVYTLPTLALPVVAGLDAVRQWAPLPFATVDFGGALFLVSMIPIG
ncbi:MAG TPA: hypothetical protein VF748_00050 [Candidatus Acidoferrum sp.]